jgi:hypothetical protein
MQYIECNYFKENTDFLAAFKEAKETFMTEWWEEDKTLNRFMVEKGLDKTEMDNFLRTFEEMYPPFTHTDMDIADKMKNAFETYEKTNHKFSYCVRHVISKVFLFLEKRTRPGMKDEQK